MIRDIICFLPLILILLTMYDIEGILFAAPAANFIVMIVAASLSVAYMRTLKSESTSAADTAAEKNAIIRDTYKGVILAIAREHGSSGKQIGKMIAERLQILFYYKEMTALAAQESGLDKEFVSNLNANSPTLMHDLYLSTNVVQQTVIAQEKVIRKIADSGSCAIVKRGADYKMISRNPWGDHRNYELLVDSSVGLDTYVNVICDYIASAQTT